jgi:hypothetical protein
MIKNSETECDSAQCLWSDGKLLIPDHDFCAPADLTDDVSVMFGCVKSDEANCNGQCMWRRGKQPASELPTTEPTNTAADMTGRLFTKNFCYPASTEIWNDNVYTCFNSSNDDANSCN